MALAMNYVSKGDRKSARELLPKLRELDADLAESLEKVLGGK